MKEQKCRACGAPFIHITGTNVFVCSNKECDGKIKQDGKVRQGSTFFLAGQDKEEKRYKKI